MKKRFKCILTACLLLLCFATSSFIKAEPIYGTVSVNNVGFLASFIGGILAGYLVDGVLIYVTGYSGREVCAKIIEWLTTRKYPKSYFETNQATQPYIYEDSSGNICRQKPTGGYVCLYSLGE